MNQARVLFRAGQVVDTEASLDQLADDLRQQIPYLHSLSSENLLDFFDTLSRYWEQHEHQRIGYTKNLVNFFRKDHLKPLLQLSLRGQEKALDEWVAIENGDRWLHAQPRGLTVHWLAGNIPTLGLFSILGALITKNVCLVKVSARDTRSLGEWLASFSQIRTSQINGSDLLQAVTVVAAADDNLSIQQQLSRHADVRVIWGGQVAVQAIVQLPKNLFCEDVIFGPKYSYALIDQESLDQNLVQLAQKLAVDVSVFDQNLCSSPHTVFVQEGGQYTARDFAEELARQLDLIHRTALPHTLIDPARTGAIIKLRMEHASKQQAWYSEGVEWTVVHSTEPGLAPAYGGRVITVKSIRKLSEVNACNNRHIQTIGLAMTKENKLQYLDNLTLFGGDRCPNLGMMTFYELPWDGIFVPDRFVRWVVIHK